MKQVLLVLLVIFVSGCSNKLTCTYKIEYDSIKIKNKIVFDFNKKEYTQIDKMIFEDKNTALNYFKEIEDYKDEYNLVLDGNIIISKINDDIKLDGTKSKIRKQYESYDYKCK